MLNIIDNYSLNLLEFVYYVVRTIPGKSRT